MPKAWVIRRRIRRTVVGAADAVVVTAFAATVVACLFLGILITGDEWKDEYPDYNYIPPRSR